MGFTFDGFRASSRLLGSDSFCTLRISNGKLVVTNGNGARNQSHKRLADASLHRFGIWGIQEMLKLPDEPFHV